MGEGGADRSDEEDYTPLVPQVRVRVVAGCDTAQQFVDEYCRYVDGDRFFVATEVTETVGNLVQLRIDLADGTVVVNGTGTVLEVRLEAWGGLPRGLVLRFVALDEASARIVDAMATRRTLARPLPPRIDPAAELRLRAGAPDGAGAWQASWVQPETVLPANPFSEVSDTALTYFVEWSIERNRSSAPSAPASVAYGDVRMRAPRRRRRRLPSWLPFLVGLASGCGAVVVVAELWAGLGTAALAPKMAPPPESAGAIALPPAAPAGVGGNGAVAPVTPPAATVPVAPQSAGTSALLSHTAISPRTAARLVPLAVTSDPGAQIFVDGERVGRTPAILRVTRGAHVLELARPRYQTARVEIVAPGRAEVHLERPRATLRVAANVADAEVFIDAEPVGRAPLARVVPAYERSLVEVRAAGVQSWRRHIYVRPPVTELRATFTFE